MADLASRSTQALSPAEVMRSNENGRCQERDPRFHIKVKKLPHTGSPSDSCIIQGLACTRNVAHRRMRALRQCPRIILLAGRHLPSYKHCDVFLKQLLG